MSVTVKADLSVFTERAAALAAVACGCTEVVATGENYLWPDSRGEAAGVCRMAHKTINGSPRNLSRRSGAIRTTAVSVLVRKKRLLG